MQFIIPAGTGGGADQMARFIQGVVAKNNLMKQPMITVNKGGGAGAEGFLEVKKASGDPHNIIITLSNLFTTPYATGVPFSWKDMTPVAMLALDQFVLWVHADTPYKTAKEYIDAVKAGDDKTFKMGGTGSKQEDQIITVALEKLTAPKKFTYVPYARRRRGGHAAGRQARQLDRQQPDRGGLAVEGRRAAGRCASSTPSAAPTRSKVTADMAWSDIPTCKEAGVDTQYQMLRGIFMPPGVKPEQVAFYVDLFKKVMATDDWKKFMEQGAFNQTFMTGDEFKKWVEASRQAAPRPDEGSGLPRRRQVSAAAGPARRPAGRLAETGRRASERAEGKPRCKTTKAPTTSRPLATNRDDGHRRCPAAAGGLRAS